MVSCTKPSRVMGPKEKNRVSWLIVVVVALDMLPALVIMGLQPQVRQPHLARASGVALL